MGKSPCECAAFGPLEIYFSQDEARRVGDSIGVDWGKIDLEQFRQGLAVEMEHGCRYPETNVTCDSLNLTGKIALVHLFEVGDYYSQLKKVEARVDVAKVS
jgi:hypothetical protein